MHLRVTCLLLLGLVSAAPAEEKPDALQSIESTRGGRHWVDAKTDPPKSPGEARQCFQIEPGLQIELFAAEPLVMDPVALAFDDRGRMFVVEYGDYPTGPDESEQALSRVVVLDDTNGDGRADRRRVFADGLSFAHSLMPLKGGMLVGARTEIVFLQDTDGDDRADVREVWFQGFAPAHPQMQIGNPRWGFDNWIYLNYGPGEITSPGRSDEPLKMPRSEFRFHPLTMEFGPASGLGQYGNTFDNWGRRFFCTNRNPIMTPRLSWEDARRNPFLAISKLHDDVGPAGGETRVYPLVEMKSNYLSHAGTHTSACGTTAYCGDLLGSGFDESVFVCEPIGHLVTRSIVESRGLQLTARRARPKADFLASTDTWFRPASLANGPDGALYLADMYRLWVEHPKFLPEEIARRLDWRAGDDRGRIWRIAPRRAKPRPFTAPQTNSDLVDLLSDPNGWRRQLGQRLLVERQAKDTAAALRSLLEKCDNPFARLHALWTLDGLDELNANEIVLALNDPHAQVRRAAVELATTRLAQNAMLVARLMERVQDPDIGVRFQIALALGETSAPAATAALTALARRDADDHWFALAILTSSSERSGAILGGLVRDASFVKTDDESRIGFIRELATVVGARGDSTELAELLRTISTATPRGVWWQTAVLKGLATGLARHQGALGRTSLAKLLAKPPAALTDYVGPVRVLLADTQRVALDRRKTIGDRVAAIGLLGYLPAERAGATYETLLAVRQPVQVQLASLESMRTTGDGHRAAQILLDRWSGLGPQVRSSALDLLLRRTDTTRAALEAMSAGKINSAILGIDQRVRLLRHGDQAIRSLAAQLFGGAISADRLQVGRQYRAALNLTGSAAAGGEIFKRSCAKCHRIDGEGHQVGPDISDVRNRSREALLYDILDPNRQVEPRFTEYIVETEDGRVFNGLMASESSDAVILRQADDKQQVIARSEIAEVHASGKSLMPEGIEKEVTVQQMADLLAYLKTRAVPSD